MKEKDKYMDYEAVINSMRKASPREGLFEKIELRLSGKRIAKLISLPAVSIAAAGILLLIMLNIAILNKQNTTGIKQGDAIEEVVNYYGLTDNAFGI